MICNFDEFVNEKFDYTKQKHDKSKYKIGDVVKIKFDKEDFYKEDDDIFRITEVVDVNDNNDDVEYFKSHFKAFINKYKNSEIFYRGYTTKAYGLNRYIPEEKILHKI